MRHFPQRIVSLVPSQTELLYDLGLGDRVVGITKFCVRPAEWRRDKTKVGGTKTVNLQQVAALQPDLILANKEENVKEQVEALASLCPVYVSDIKNLDDALAMIREVGVLTGAQERAALMAADIQARFSDVAPAEQERERVLYVIWRRPWMGAGGDTFIHDMLRRCGWENVLEAQSRYPSFTATDLLRWQPDRILLSSEPFPFKARHIAEFREYCPQARVELVDGEAFSWYGSRLLSAALYFKTLS